MIAQEISLCNEKDFVAFWDFFTTEWCIYLANVDSDNGALPATKWRIFPSLSWKLLPEPYFGNTCSSMDLPPNIKGVIINLNPFSCEELGVLEQYDCENLNYGERNGKIVIDPTHPTYQWMTNKRIEWLSALTESILTTKDALIMELIPWHSTAWTAREKKYAMAHAELIFRKIYAPAIYYSNEKISKTDLLHRVVICRGVDHGHIINKLFPGIQQLFPNDLTSGKWKLNAYLLFGCDRSSIFIRVWKSRSLGVDFPSVETEFESPQGFEDGAKTKTLSQIVRLIKQEV